MKRLILAAALLVGAAARAGEACPKELRAYENALDRAAKAQQALQDYDSSPLAPVVPGQADKERQRLQDQLEAARADVRLRSDDHDRCTKKKKCSKWKGGWKCTIAWTYEDCCLDKQQKSKGKGSGKGR
jgi:hypothetical protein